MQLSVFKYQSPEEEMLNEIRSIEIDGEFWFVASDVAKTLGYKNAPDAIARHCKIKGIVKHDSLKSETGSLLTLINSFRLFAKTFRTIKRTYNIRFCAIIADCFKVG